jgi:hypothetical protein
VTVHQFVFVSEFQEVIAGGLLLALAEVQTTVFGVVAVFGEDVCGAANDCRERLQRGLVIRDFLVAFLESFLDGRKPRVFPRIGAGVALGCFRRYALGRRFAVPCRGCPRAGFQLGLSRRVLPRGRQNLELVPALYRPQGRRPR